MNSVELLQTTLTDTLAGKLAFPEVIRILSEAGVQSYRTDMVRREVTYSMTNGAVHVLPMQFAGSPVAGPFSGEQVVAAIRESQAGRLIYPDFLTRVMDAGTCAYDVDFDGRQAVYYGSGGDSHVERFPGSR